MSSSSISSTLYIPWSEVVVGSCTKTWKNSENLAGLSSLKLVSPFGYSSSSFLYQAWRWYPPDDSTSITSFSGGSRIMSSGDTASSITSALLSARGGVVIVVCSIGY